MFHVYSIVGSRGLQFATVHVVAESEEIATHDGLKALESCLPQIHMAIENVAVMQLFPIDAISPNALRHFTPLANSSLEEDGLPRMAAHAASDHEADFAEENGLDCDGDE